MASSIVKSAAKQLGNLLVEEAKYLYEVRDKVEKLQAELEWMECFLRDADTQQHEEEVICRWVSQIRDLAYDAEDIIQKYLHQVTHHRRRNGILNTLKWFSRIVCTRDVFTLHELGSEIEDMTIQISDLTSRLQRYGIQIIRPTTSLEYNPMSREERMTYSHIDEDVVGLKKDIQQVVDQVLRADVKVVSISGTSGLGKTTLARKVFNSKQIQDGYTCAWVYISQEFDRTRIFKEILSGLDKQSVNMNVGAAELPQKIDEILRMEKCFVVLDDIWTVDAWKRLKPAFESIFRTSESVKSSKSVKSSESSESVKICQSKILITTRKQDLLPHVDSSSGYLHLLKPLSPGDSWELLMRKASLTDGCTDQVTCEQLEMMLSHCDGLPLAIIALGGILSTRKTITEWKDVQQNISSYLMSGEQGHESGAVSKVLELSYHNLPFYLKPCFLYMGSFPEGFKISAQKLYQLWQAEGLLTVEREAAKASSYDVGERFLDELVQRSMVQVEKYRKDNGRIEICKLHDIMRDLCLKKGEEINFLNMVESNELNLETVLAGCYIENKKQHRRIAVNWIPNVTTKWSEIPTKKKTKWSEISYKHVEKKATCIRSLLVFPTNNRRDDYCNLLGRVWKPMELLRVLDLEGAPVKGNLEGVEKLIHLRFLSLKDTYITELPTGFWDLKCLETLDLRCCNSRFSYFGTIMRLPSKQLGKLEKLRHLYLSIRFNVMENGEKLSLPASSRMETLVNFDPGRCEIKDLQKMTNLKLFVINPNYRMNEEDELKGVLEGPVMKNSGQLLNTLRLVVNVRLIEAEPAILSSLAAPPSSFALKLFSNNNAIRSDTLYPDSLTRLEIFTCQIGDATILALGKLPYLKHLYLNECVLLDDNIMIFFAGGFPQLTHLYLQEMSMLEKWVVEDGALPKLQHLELIFCRELKKLPQGLPQSVDIVFRAGYPGN